MLHSFDGRVVKSAVLQQQQLWVVVIVHWACSSIFSAKTRDAWVYTCLSSSEVVLLQQQQRDVLLRRYLRFDVRCTYTVDMLRLHSLTQESLAFSPQQRDSMVLRADGRLVSSWRRPGSDCPCAAERVQGDAWSDEKERHLSLAA